MRSIQDILKGDAGLRRDRIINNRTHPTQAHPRFNQANPTRPNVPGFVTSADHIPGSAMSQSFRTPVAGGGSTHNAEFRFMRSK